MSYHSEPRRQAVRIFGQGRLANPITPSYTRYQLLGTVFELSRFAGEVTFDGSAYPNATVIVIHLLL